MSDKGIFPTVERRWSQDGLIIGWSPPTGPVEIAHVSHGDRIVLHGTSYRAVGRTGDQKLFDFVRNRGDYSFTPNGVDTYVRAEGLGELLYVIFTPEYRKQFIDEYAPSVTLDHFFDPDKGMNRYDELSNLMMDFLLSDGFGGKLRGEAIASLVLGEAVQELGKTPGQTDKYHLAPQRMRQITEFIDTHLSGTISVSDLSEIAGISKFHFTRMFKLETGLSPYQFVLRHRIQKARELISRSELSLAEISIDAGFSSQSHMNDAFMRVLGVSPGQYRKDIKS